jgi:hypothetical protein
VVSLWGRQWRRDELLARVGRLEQVAGVRLTEGGDGAERGVRLLRCSTGAGFEFEILVDRGFDIGGAWLGGRPLAWASPVGLVGPWYGEPAGIGWFRGFPGGLVSTCGLDHTLLGGADDSTVFNYPHRATETYGLHGRYTGLPARLAGYGARWDGDDCVLWAEGEVLQAALFGEQLQLRRRVEADLGGVSVRITDTVTNIGPTPCPHMMLYHCNVGFPVVDAGAELAYPAGPGTCVSEASTLNYQERAAGRLRGGVLRARHAARAGRPGRRGRDQPGGRARRLPALRPGHAAPAHHLAAARHSGLRGRDGAEH